MSGWTQADIDAVYARRQRPEAPVVAPQAKAKGKQGHTPGQMNKTESRYAQYLELRKIAGEITDYKFEAVTVKLGPDCRYSPDFMVRDNAGFISFVEVKARDKKTGKALSRDDSKVKIRVAAQQFPEFVWIMAWPLPNGSWAEKVIQ